MENHFEGSGIDDPYQNPLFQDDVNLDTSESQQFDSSSDLWSTDLDADPTFSAIPRAGSPGSWIGDGGHVLDRYGNDVCGVYFGSNVELPDATTQVENPYQEALNQLYVENPYQDALNQLYNTRDDYLDSTNPNAVNADDSTNPILSDIEQTNSEEIESTPDVSDNVTFGAIDRWGNEYWPSSGQKIHPSSWS